MDAEGSDGAGGARVHSQQHPRPPTWFTPLRLLLLFCVTNMTVYLDRGVIASNGVNGAPRSEALPAGAGIQGEFGLTNFQDGLLATAFLVGLLLASPVFSEAAKHASAFRLLGAGMGAWVVAAAGCGAAPSYGVMLACRALVGVGEASFVALAAPFIDDYAPPEHKARWFAAFYLCIPVGFAAGYIYGGAVAAALGWRAAFFIEAAAMAPFVAFCFLSRPLHLRGSHDSGAPDPSRPRTARDAASELARDAAAVARHPVWLCMAGGYSLYTAVLGVYAFWGPKAGAAIFGLPGERADLVFGGVTVATGILGSLGGGLLLDYLGSSLRNANLLCAAACLAGGVLVEAAFLLSRSFAAFVALFALGELALFLLQAPIGGLGMWCVPAPLRPLAISLVTVAIHVLGDVPSPPLVGAVQSALERGKPPAEAAQMWRVSVGCVSALLFAAGAVFLLNARLSVGAPDYRKKRGEAAGDDDEAGGGGGGGAAAAGDGASLAAAAATLGGGALGGDRAPLLQGLGADSSGGDGASVRRS